MNKNLSYILIGLLAGIIGGLLGLGGGIIMVPAFVFLLNKDQHVAHGTSLFVIAPLALIGSCTYALGGNLNLNIAVWLVIGGMLGAYLGAYIANMLPSHKLRFVYAVFLTFIGIKMIIGS